MVTLGGPARSKPWVRGKGRVAAGFLLLAAAVNLARRGVLGLASDYGAWVVTS